MLRQTKKMDVKSLLNTYFNWIAKAGLVIVILSTLFLFNNFTTEFYDTPKFLVLLVITGILLVLITLRFTLNNKVTLLRTPLDIPLLLLLVVGIVSTFVSPAPFVSLLGNQLKINGSLVSLAVYVVFYLCVVNSLRTKRQISGVIFITTIAGAVLSVVTLLSYAGVKLLPSPWVYGISFTPTGSSFSTSAILAMLVPIVTSYALAGSSLTVQLLNAILLTLFGVTIALTGTWATWTAALLGFVLSLLGNGFFEKLDLSNLKNARLQTTLIGVLVPVALVVLVVFLSFIPPIGGTKNPLYTQARAFPKDLQLGVVNSWKTSVSAFRDSPFWGTGPSTYLFDFTSYKPLEYNSTKNWNLRFDSSFNEYLQVLATLGGIGLLALISLTALFISSAWSSIVSRQADSTTSISHQLLKKALAVSGVVFFVILTLHASTLVLWVVGLFVLALFMVFNMSDSETSLDASTDFKRVISQITSFDSTTQTIRVEALPSVLLVISLGAVLFTFFFAGKFAVADNHHRKALNAISQNQGVVAYNELVAAEKLNPINDLYRTDLAQTNFALANAIVTAKGPTQDNPQGNLTDQDKQNIQVLLQQSINEGRVATTLNPRSAQNWEILGLLYRQIAGVAQNALAFSLDSYGRAIFADPLNPQLRLNVGGVYYAIKNYDLAIRFFTDSINLKPDFANGYYNLSVALRDKGDLNTAQAAVEKALTLLDKNSQDYQTATNYLNDLRTKKGDSTTQPPAAQASGALQNEELPKVIDLNKPEKIATPPAVKKPNSTPEPTATPIP